MASIRLVPQPASRPHGRVLVISPFEPWSEKIAAGVPRSNVRWIARLDAAEASACDVVVCDIAATRGVSSLRDFVRNLPLSAVIVVGVADAGARAELLSDGALACADRSNVGELVALIKRSVAATAGHRDVAVDREPGVNALADAAFDAIIVERDGVIAGCNRMAEEMLGVEGSRLIGTPLQTLLDGRLCAAMTGLSVGESFRASDASITTADGRRVSVEICAAGSGADERVLALRDRSASRSGQSNIEKSEFRYWNLFDNTHDLICTHDLEGQILSVNQAVSRVLGFPAEELIGTKICDLLLSEQRSDFDRVMRELLVNGASAGTMTVVARNGRRHCWEFRNTLETIAGGQVVVRGFARDVTDREEAAARLRRSEGLFRSILETTSDLVGILDVTGVIRYHSPSVERVMGFAGAEINGQELVSFAAADDVSRLRDALERQVRHVDAAQIIDVNLRKSDNTTRSFEIAMKNAVRGGRVESIVVSARDTTERHLLEAQLAQAQRLNSLGRLAATVAHEFNNVLMGMQPFAELLQRNGLPAAAHVKSAQHIANSIQRGKRVALDILRFTQPATPEVKDVDLAAWWTNMLPELQAQTPSHISFTSAVPAGIHVLADAAQLSQVFSNLISNARDAMPSRGSLSVSARLPGEHETFAFGVITEPSRYVHISVSDDGIGIPQDLIEHVFEPLVTTKENGGTGLGLAVTHQIVARHAGHIFVESKPGHGAVFHVFLPRATPDTSVVPVEPERPCSPGLRKIVMIEDELFISEGLALLLDGEGVTVHAVSTGAAAEEAVRIHQPDAVVVDLGLPDMDGTEVAMRLRATHPDLPIVFATGHGDREATGCDHLSRFLRKPFEISDLLSALGELDAERHRFQEVSS